MGKYVKKISDFIYDHPDVVVVLLNQNGYNVRMDTATISLLNNYVFTILHRGNKKFADELESAMLNEGYDNIVPILVAGGISVVSSIIGGMSAKSEAKKQRELQKNIALANLASNDKLASEQLQATSETERTKILANSLLEYRKTLQETGTQRIKDTWIYVLGLAMGIATIAGIFLITEKD